VARSKCARRKKILISAGRSIIRAKVRVRTPRARCFILFSDKLVTFCSGMVLSDSGATKNAKGRVRARGITGAGWPPPSKFSQYLEIRSPSDGRRVIALSYDSLSPFSLFPSLSVSSAGTKAASILPRQGQIAVLEKG